MLWELLAADIEGVEGICAVGAVLQQIFFRFGLLLHGFVLAEAVATALHSGGLDGEDEVVVVLAVEVRHEALLAGEALVDEEIFLVVAHRVAEVHVLHRPPLALEFVDYYPMKVLVVDGIVGAEGGGIVVVDDRVRGMCGVVSAEVGDERRDFALELDVERFEDVQAVAPWLTADNPVDVGVVVHADGERLHRVDVRIRAAVERGVERGEVGERADGIPILLCLTDNLLVAEGVEVREIRGIVLVVFLHGGIKAVVRDANLLTEDGRLERLGREVALHLPDILLTEKLEVFQGRIFLVVHRHGAHAVERLVEPFEVARQVSRHRLVCGFERGDALLGLPNLVDCALDGVDELGVHLLLVVQEPRALGGLRHIGEDHHGVVERVMPEVRANAAVGRERLVFEFVVVDELRLVDEQPRERERVGRAGAVHCS